MEVAPFIASSALIGVVAQRLVRRLCLSCRVKTRFTKGYLAERGCSMDDIECASGYAASEKGCDDCHGTGYKGRVGVFEIMAMDEELERLFLAEAPSETIRVAALAAGMRTLRDDAMDKVAAGVTSLDEVLRVIA
jgi:type II secretory ATPase GspE/PulE/Tfp pilus assembly ATPase PilB-like protein